MRNSMTAVLCCVVLYCSVLPRKAKWGVSSRMMAVVWCAMLCSAVLYGGALPDEEELRIALHTLIARELTGTGNTTRQEKRRKEKIRKGKII